MPHTYVSHSASVTVTATVAFGNLDMDNPGSYQTMASVTSLTPRLPVSSNQPMTSSLGEEDLTPIRTSSPLSLSPGTLGVSPFSFLPTPAQTNSHSMHVPAGPDWHYSSEFGSVVDHEDSQCFSSTGPLAESAPGGHCDQNIVDDGVGGWLQGDYNRYSHYSSEENAVYPSDNVYWNDLDCYPQDDRGLGRNIHADQRSLMRSCRFTQHFGTTGESDGSSILGPSISEHLGFLQENPPFSLSLCNPGSQCVDLQPRGSQQYSTSHCCQWYETDLDDHGEQPLISTPVLTHLRNRSKATNSSGSDDAGLRMTLSRGNHNDSGNCIKEQSGSSKHSPRHGPILTQTYEYCVNGKAYHRTEEETPNNRDVQTVHKCHKTNTKNESSVHGLLKTSAYPSALTTPKRSVLSAQNRDGTDTFQITCGAQINTSADDNIKRPAVSDASVDSCNHPTTDDVCTAEQDSVSPGCSQPFCPDLPLSSDTPPVDEPISCQPQRLSRLASGSSMLNEAASQYVPPCHMSDHAVVTDRDGLSATSAVHDVGLSSMSSSSSSGSPLIDVDHLLSSGVTVAGFKPRPIIRKRRKVMIPSTQKDGSYWHKRKKNNDSAKRSREAKKEKEKNFYRRALELEYENYFLKERLGQVEAQLHAFTGVAPNTPVDYMVPTSRVSNGVAPQAPADLGVPILHVSDGMAATASESGASVPRVDDRLGPAPSEYGVPTGMTPIASDYGVLASRANDGLAPIPSEYGASTSSVNDEGAPTHRDYGVPTSHVSNGVAPTLCEYGMLTSRVNNGVALSTSDYGVPTSSASNGLSPAPSDYRVPTSRVNNGVASTPSDYGDPTSRARNGLAPTPNDFGASTSRVDNGMAPTPCTSDYGCHLLCLPGGSHTQ